MGKARSFAERVPTSDRTIDNKLFSWVSGDQDRRRGGGETPARVGLGAGGEAAALDAVDRLVEALDLEREDPAVRDRYGRGSADPAFGEDAGPHWMDQFLMARRLVEAGVRCVTLSFGSWDRHGGNFERLPTQLAKFDQGITALVEDLHARGLDRDVSVVAWGEFGLLERREPIPELV